MDKARLRKSIIHHEGYEKRPYCDSKGFWTVGYGHKVHGMECWQYGTTIGELLTHLSSEDKHLEWLDQDITNAHQLARRIFSDVYWRVDELRQEVLIELCYWMGNNVRTFVKFHQALRDKDYRQAALEMLDSQAGRNFATRMGTLSTLMEMGEPENAEA